MSRNSDAVLAALKIDGIATGKNVSVQFVNGKLLINGKEQSMDVLKRYKIFLDGKEETK